MVQQISNMENQELLFQTFTDVSHIQSVTKGDERAILNKRD